jgi:hypothetical protein
MLTRCIVCHKIWGVDDHNGDITDGLCPFDLEQRIKQIQRSHGFPDCFGTAEAYCDRADCKYQGWCQRVYKEKKERG